MDKEQIIKKATSLFKEKANIDKEIEELQNQLVKELCPKEKQECEPEYCMLRITDTCPFLKEWRSILEEAQAPEDDKYDLFIEFIEKISEDKSVIHKLDSDLSS